MSTGSYDRYKTFNRNPLNIELSLPNYISRKAPFDRSETRAMDWLEHRSYHHSLYSIYRKGNREGIRNSIHLNNQEKIEFCRFFDCLVLWEYYTPKISKPYDGEYYWINSISQGPIFAKRVADLFAFGYRNTFGIDYKSPKGFEQIRIFSYNDIFPVAGMLRFKEEIEDFKFSINPLTVNIHDEVFQELSPYISDALKSIPKLEMISEQEILSEIKTTSCWVEGSEKFEPFWKSFDKKFSKVMVGKRCVVPVYPTGVRDTVVLTRSSSNSVRILERQFRYILEYMPESAFCSSSATYHKRMSRQRTNYRTIHYLRDIKKCGLSMPMTGLIFILKDQLQEIFPHYLWDLLDIYINRRIYGYGKEPVNPPRGYCLGMANHIATFLLIVIYRLSVEEFHMSYDEYDDIHFEALIGNDDSDIRIYMYESDYNSEHLTSAAKAYAGVHQEVLSRYDIWYNEDKSFLSWEGLFFEEYTNPSFKFKESRYAIAVANAISTGEIRLAKYMLKSYLEGDQALNYKVIESMISYAASYFLPEFDYGESSRDYYLGGWIPKRRFGLSTCLEDLLGIELNMGYLTNIFLYILRIERYKPKREYFSNLKDPPFSPIALAMGLKRDNESKLGNIFMTQLEIQQYYKNVTLFERNVTYLYNLIKTERKVFLQKIQENSPYSLATIIANEIDCTIPHWLVKNSKPLREWIHPSWLGNPEQDVPNKLIKSICVKTINGQFQTDLDIENFPYHYSWEYLDLESKQLLSLQREEEGFIYISSEDEVNNYSSDGYSAAALYCLENDRAPTSLFIGVCRLKQKPMWRNIKYLVRNDFPTNREYLALEDVPHEEEPPLKFFGSVILKPKILEQEIQEEMANRPDDIWANKDDLINLIRFEDLENLYNFPIIAKEHLSKLCENHSQGLEVGYIDQINNQKTCIACRINSILQYMENYDIEKRNLVKLPAYQAETLLKRLGIHIANPFDLCMGDSDDGGAFGDMFS